VSLMSCGDCGCMYGPTILVCPKCGSGNVSRVEVQPGQQTTAALPAPAASEGLRDEELRAIRERDAAAFGMVQEGSEPGARLTLPAEDRHRLLAEIDRLRASEGLREEEVQRIDGCREVVQAFRALAGSYAAQDGTYLDAEYAVIRAIAWAALRSTETPQ